MDLLILCSKVEVCQIVTIYSLNEYEKNDKINT